MLENDADLSGKSTQAEGFNDPELRRQVLSVYFTGARYLESSDVFFDKDQDGNALSSKGDFSIRESCYIQDTGHFNSVEFNICYNQIMYDAIAHAAKYGLADCFAAWGVEGFFARQLPDILIARFQSRFNRPIDSRKFYGEFAIRSVRLHRGDRPFLFLKTTCRFFDRFRGEATGEVDLAIVNP